MPVPTHPGCPKQSPSLASAPAWEPAVGSTLCQRRRWPRLPPPQARSAAGEGSRWRRRAGWTRAGEGRTARQPPPWWPAPAGRGWGKGRGWGRWIPAAVSCPSRRRWGEWGRSRACWTAGRSGRAPALRSAAASGDPGSSPWSWTTSRSWRCGPPTSPADCVLCSAKPGTEKCWGNISSKVLASPLTCNRTLALKLSSQWLNFAHGQKYTLQIHDNLP